MEAMDKRKQLEALFDKFDGFNRDDLLEEICLHYLPTDEAIEMLKSIANTWDISLDAEEDQ